MAMEKPWQMLGQRAGDFALELFEHRWKRHRAGRISLTGALDVTQGLRHGFLQIQMAETPCLPERGLVSPPGLMN